MSDASVNDAKAVMQYRGQCVKVKRSYLVHFHR